MKLQQALKTSLDELRMQMLGVQVLFGFQFQGLFQNNFEALSARGRSADAVGLGMMILALALLIAAPSQHRLVEHGENTMRIYKTSMWYAEMALLPLAVGLGCDVFVAVSAPFGELSSLLLAAAVFAAALLAWYVLGSRLRTKWQQQGKGAAMEDGKTPLHAKIEQMLIEARVILPGAQALLGFQLVVMMTQAFEKLDRSVQLVHLAALASLVLTIILLICPAAIHRIAFRGNDDPRLHSTGTLLITLALLPLSVGISCDLWVALTILFGEGIPALVGAAGALALLLVLWFILPMLLKRRLAAASPVAVRH
jgi:hypothetical protein